MTQQKQHDATCCRTIGVIGKQHGTRGEMQMHFTDDIFDRQESDFVFLRIDGLPVPFFFEEYRFKSDSTAIVKMEGVDTPERAKELTGCEVMYPESRFDDDDGQLSYAQLVGYTLIDATTQQTVGTIDRVDEQTENILFEVGQRLIPAAEELIESIDNERQTITLSIPEGLLAL